jgi:hypothetical protein
MEKNVLSTTQFRTLILNLMFSNIYFSRLACSGKICRDFIEQLTGTVVVGKLT